jgi:hypothetical protein
MYVTIYTETHIELCAVIGRRDMMVKSMPYKPKA